MCYPVSLKVLEIIYIIAQKKNKIQKKEALRLIARLPALFCFDVIRYSRGKYGR